MAQILEEGDIVVLAKPVRGEFTVKRSGIWRLHKYDQDDIWPSNCHAHNIEDSREVLDLYTGYIFNKSTRQRVRQLSKKDLMYVQEEFGLHED